MRSPAKTGSPSISMSARSGRSSRFTQRIRVVLPPPLEPMMLTIFPRSTLRPTPSSTSRPSKDFREALDAGSRYRSCRHSLLEQNARRREPAPAAWHERNARRITWRSNHNSAWDSG